MDASPTVPLRTPLSVAVASRAVGLWILVGCALKAFVGTPGDLPAILRSLPLPLPIGTTFALVLGIEAFVGIAMLLRPGRAWPLATLVLLVFIAVLTTQVVAGAKSCGCFGSKIQVPPWAMLAIDLTMLALLFVSRPWRLAHGGRGDLVAVVLALAAAIALPTLVDREAVAGAPASAVAGLRKWASLDVTTWKGKKVTDLDLAKWVDLSTAHDGVWYLYRDSCQICALCLQNVAVNERGEREVTLIRIGETGEAAAHQEVHMLPTGPFVHRIELPSTVDWSVTAPTRVVVEGGVVTSAKQGIDPDDCP